MTSFNKIAVVCVALLAVLVFCGVDGLINGNKIYEGVVIGDVAVGGLTKDEAVDRVSVNTPNVFLQTLQPSSLRKIT